MLWRFYSQLRYTNRRYYLFSICEPFFYLFYMKVINFPSEDPANLAG